MYRPAASRCICATISANFAGLTTRTWSAYPQTHQAMFEAPVPGTRAGEIIQVAAVGFFLHDRLLRPAQVGVSSTLAS